MDRYCATIRMRRQHGFRAYGLYLRVVELVELSGNRLLYDIEDLVFDTREEPDFIKTIIEDYGLFVISDGFLSDALLERQRDAEDAEKRRRRSEAAKRAAATRKAKKTAQQETTVETLPTLAKNESVKPIEVVVKDNAQIPNVETGGDKNDESQDNRDPSSRLFDKIKNAWNAAFTNTRQQYRDVVPSALCWNYFLQSSRVYKLDDFKEAFEQAAREKFAWILRDALKPENMQRLLANSEIRKRNEKKRREKDDPQYDFQTQEIIDYAESRGWNWDN